MSVDLQALFGRLNQQTRGVLENAAGLCQSRTHYDIEIEHYVMKLLDTTDSDVAAILKNYGIDRARVATDVTRSLDRMKTGNGGKPFFSPLLIKMLKEAWTMGSLEFGATEIRTGHTLLALVTQEDLRRVLNDMSREFQKLTPDKFRLEFATVVAKSPEQVAAQSYAGAPGEAQPRGDG